MNREQLLRIADETLAWAETRPDVTTRVLLLPDQGELRISLRVGRDLREIPINLDAGPRALVWSLDECSKPKPPRSGPGVDVIEVVARPRASRPGLPRGGKVH